MDSHDYYKFPHDLVEKNQSLKDDNKTMPSSDQLASLGEMLLGQSIKASNALHHAVPNLDRKIPDVTDKVEVPTQKKRQVWAEQAQKEMMAAKKILEKIRMTNEEVQKLKKSAKTIQDRHQKLTEELEESIEQVSVLKKDTATGIDRLKHLLEESERVLDRSRNAESENKDLIETVERGVKRLLSIESEVRAGVEKNHDRDHAQRKLQSELFDIQNNMRVALSNVDSLKNESSSIFNEINLRWDDLNENKKKLSVMLKGAEESLGTLEYFYAQFKDDQQYFKEDYQEKRSEIEALSFKVMQQAAETKTLHDQMSQVACQIEHQQKGFDHQQAQEKYLLDSAEQSTIAAKEAVECAHNTLLQCQTIAGLVEENKETISKNSEEFQRYSEQAEHRLKEIQDLTLKSSESQKMLDGVVSIVKSEALSFQQESRDLIQVSQKASADTKILHQSVNHVLNEINVQKKENERVHEKSNQALVLTNKAYQEVIKISAESQVGMDEVKKIVESTHAVYDECQKIYDKNIFVQEYASDVLKEILKSKSDTEESVRKIDVIHDEFKQLHLKVNDTMQAQTKANEESNALYGEITEKGRVCNEEASKLLSQIEKNRSSYYDELEQLNQLLRENRLLSSKLNELVSKEEVYAVHVEKGILQNEKLRKELILLKNKNDNYSSQIEEALNKFSSAQGKIDGVLSNVDALKNDVEQTFSHHAQLHESLKCLIEKNKIDVDEHASNIQKNIEDFNQEKSALLITIGERMVELSDNERAMRHLHAFVHDEVEEAKKIYASIQGVHNTCILAQESIDKEKESMLFFREEGKKLFDKSIEIQATQQIFSSRFDEKWEALCSSTTELNQGLELFKQHQKQVDQLFEQSELTSEKARKINEKSEHVLDKMATMLSHVSEIAFEIKTKKVEFDDVARANIEYRKYVESAIEKNKESSYLLDKKIQVLDEELSAFYLEKNRLFDLISEQEAKNKLTDQSYQKTINLTLNIEKIKSDIDNTFEEQKELKKSIFLINEITQEELLKVKQKTFEIESLTEENKKIKEELKIKLQDADDYSSNLQALLAHAESRHNEKKLELENSGEKMNHFAAKAQELLKQHKESMVTLKESQLINRESRINQKEMQGDIRACRQEIERLSKENQQLKNDQPDASLQHAQVQAIKALQAQVSQQMLYIKQFQQFIQQEKSAAVTTNKDIAPKNGLDSTLDNFKESSKNLFSFPSDEEEADLLADLDERLHATKYFESKRDPDKKKGIKNFLL